MISKATIDFDKAEITEEGIFQYCTWVKNAFLVSLRETFSHPDSSEAYRYNKESELSQISIEREYAKKTTKFPAIVIEAEPGDVSISSLGSEQIDTEYSDEELEQYRVYAGKLTMPVKITILGETCTDRDKLIDLVSIYVRYLFRDIFYRNGLLYVDIKSGADSPDTRTSGRLLHKGSVKIQVHAEIRQKVPMSLFEAIESLNFSELLFGTDESDLQSNNE